MNIKRTVMLVGISLLGPSLVLSWLLGSTGLQISHAAGYDAIQKPNYQGFQTIPIDGLVAYYPFNNNANDESGNGNDGTVFGATLATDRFGNQNHAYSFDGMDDYIDLGDQNIIDDSAAFSVSLWANISGGSDDGPTMIRLKGYTSEFQYAHRVNPGAIYFGFRSFMGLTCNEPQCILDNFIGEWHHHLFVYEGGDKNSLGSYKLYRDGEEISLESAGFVGGSENANELGRDWWNLNYLAGMLDDIRIYNRELTESEILALYYEGVTDPVITSITPNSAAANTGNLPVVISGYNFSTPASAQLDGVSLLDVNLVSSTTLSAVVPVNSLDVGVYDLVVTSAGTTATLQDAFTVGHAGLWYVTPDGDDGNDCLSPAAPCATINGAIGKATGGDTIYVAMGTYTGTGDEVVLIDKDIALSGGWDETFSIQSVNSALDGEGARRCIYVSPGVTANVDHFTVQHGYMDDNGGGIYNFLGTLTLNNSIVIHNTSYSYGGGVFNEGTLTINNSTVISNTSQSNGGGIYNMHLTLTLNNSTVSNNTSHSYGGGISNNGTLNINHSTVSHNTASNSGGGVYGSYMMSTSIVDTQIYANIASSGNGGGVATDSWHRLNMSSSWVVGNAALVAGAGGVGINGQSAYIENSIIAGNNAGGAGGGLQISAGFMVGPYQILNSHIVGNEANGDGAAIMASISVPPPPLPTTKVEIGNTLIISNKGITGIKGNSGEILLSHCDTYGNSPDGTYGATITRNNCLGTPPEDGLDPLMAGGTLPSEAGPDYAEQWLSYDYRLLPGSPAIDAGTPAGAPATDIDGTPRDATPDLGAYEGWVTYPIIKSITPNTAASSTGDLPVVISGYNFSIPISAQLDGVSLLDVNLVSSTTLSAVVPVNSLDIGVYDLVVTSAGTTATLQDAFTVGHAGPWYVTPDGDDGNDCLSPADPCATINGAMNKPVFLTDSTILVAEGTYTGTGDEVVLLNKSVTLSGGWDEAFTVQVGTSTINGEDARRGIYVDSDVTANVDRFTVQHGYTEDGNGGGIYNSGALTLTNNTITDSFAEYYGYFGHGGGGIYNIGSLTLINSSVNHNTARDGGGGVYATNGSSTVIIDSKIYANTSINWEGGGILVQDSHLNLSRSWVVGNAALDNDVGGLQVSGGSAYIENSIIAGNFTDRTGGGFRFSGYGPYRIVNSHIVGNEANGEGAAIAGNEAQIEITNTLVISNTGITGIDSSFGDFLLSHCDTYGNSPDGTVGVTIARTNCLGTPPEDGLDPLMAGGALPIGVGPDYAEQWLSYDYRLLSGSPAIDAGTATGAPATDIDGNPRDATPDLGAYEVIHVEVSIDIKPGGDSTPINCSNTSGVIPVAILTTDTFDATTVDHTTVSFEGASETHVNKKTGEPIRHVEDVDLDGDMDLVFHFSLDDTALICESTEGTLIGETYDGIPIEGSDSIRMIDQDGS